MSLYLAQFITVAIVHLLAVMSPGPDFAMVTRNSFVYSRKVGIYTSLGIACGILVHVAYSLLGVGFIIAQSIVLFTVIKYIGAAYLIYIGFKSLLAKPASKESREVHAAKTDISLLSAFKIGFWTNVLNPKATLFFLALFTQVISPTTPMFVQILYGLEMMIITGVWFSLIAYFFSHPLIRNRMKKVQHHIERATGAVLIALGIKVALSSQK